MQPKGGSDPNILAFDTSGPHVSAAVFCGSIRAEIELSMARGQAEHLMGTLQAVLSQAGGALENIDALAVGIGPGNFTGIRISVAAAEGLGLGLGIPVIGVSTFEAMLDPDGPLAEPGLVVSVPAPRDQAYVQLLRYGKPVGAPRLIDPATPPQDLEVPVNMRVRGFRAADIARSFGVSVSQIEPEHIAAQIARMGDIKWRDDSFDRRAAPLYVRPADAAPPKDPPVRIVP